MSNKLLDANVCLKRLIKWTEKNYTVEQIDSIEWYPDYNGETIYILDYILDEKRQHLTIDKETGIIVHRFSKEKIK